MADQLGEASLRIEVDLETLQKSLERAKALVEKELGGTIRQQGERAAARGNRPNGPGSGITAEQRAASTILKLRNSINVLEARGVSVSQLRARLSDVEAAAANRQFAAVRQQGEELRQIISAEQNRLQVSGITTRNLEKQEKAILKIAKANAVPVSGIIKTAGLPAFQFPGSPGIRGGRPAPTPSTASTDKAAASERKLARERERAAAATTRAAKREQDELARRRRDAARTRRDVAANALIGAGFPLLFGQGFGAAAGGAIGGGLGALGGGTFGFAGSIAGTALGAAFDTALQKGTELARGLDDPIKNFEALRQAALLSSRAVEKNAEALIASGREEEAAALLRQDLLKTFGTTEGYEEFAKASDELNRSFSQATVALAQFVAGPLADFLSAFATGLGGGANIRFAQENAARAREIIQRDPQQERRFRQLAQQRGLQLGANLEVNPRDLAARNALVEEFLRSGGELTAQQKQQIKNEKEMNAAMQSGNTLKALSAKLAVEQARGNELSAAQTERELIAAEKRSKLNLLPAGATQTQRRLVEESFTEREAANAERIRNAQDTINRAAFEEQQRRREINTSISNTISLLGTQSGQYRDTLRTIQNINTSIEESRRKQAELGFQIDQARQAGQEERASALVDQQRTAAAETRLQLVQGALALTEAGERLRDSVRNAAVQFTQIRSSAEGLNRFLGQGQREERARQDLNTLLPFFRQAQGRFQELTGVQAPEFRGTTQGVNAAVRDFIEAVNREDEARRNLVGAQQSLLAVNQNLVSINTQLATATQALAAKEWTVEVQVNNQAGGATTVNAINALAQ